MTGSVTPGLNATIAFGFPALSAAGKALEIGSVVEAVHIVGEVAPRRSTTRRRPFASGGDHSRMMASHFRWKSARRSCVNGPPRGQPSAAAPFPTESFYGDRIGGRGNRWEDKPSDESREVLEP